MPEEENIVTPPGSDKKPRSEHRINFGRLFLGAILVLLGVLYLAKNAGLLPVDWHFNFVQLWPLLLVFWGLSMISGRGSASVVIGIMLILLVLALLGVVFFGNPRMETALVRDIPIMIAKEAGIKSTAVELKSGAGKISVRGGATDLVDGRLETNFLDLVTGSRVEDGVQKVELQIENKWDRFFDSARKVNNLDLALNSETPVSFYLKGGAAAMDLDLSEVTAELVNIDAGASSVNLILGDKVANGKVAIHAGASSIKIILPKTVGAKLNVNSGLSSRNLADFKQTGERTYESNNYKSVQKFVEIDLDLGVSSLDINWK